MGDHDAPTNAGPVVICCAKADAATIRPVVEELEKQGHMVALLDGVEQSPDQLAPTVERLHGEGLYVLCRSKALGRNAVDELRDILLAHHVPFGRTLTVASTRPRELRERIGASLRRLATSKARRMSTLSPDGPPAREQTQLGMAPPPPKKRGGDDFESEVPTDVRPQMMKTRVGLPTPTVPVPKAPPPPPPTPSARPQPEPAPEPEPEPEDVDGDLDLEVDEDEPPARLTPAVEPEPDPITASALIRPDDLSDLDLPGDLDDMQTGQMPVRTGNTTVSKVIPPVRTGDTAIVSRETLLAAGLAQTPNTTGTTVRSPAIPEPEPEVGDVLPSKPPWKWIGIGVATLAVVAALAIAFSGEDDDAEGDDAPKIADADDPKSGGDSPDPSPSEDGTQAAEHHEGVVADAPGPTRIGHALRSREIRALDVLLVSNTEGPFSYEAAKAHCSGLALAGLASWRLPEVGELMSLTDAEMTGRGYYWTKTPADTFGDTPLVWWARRSRVVTRDGDNYVLCVRGGTAAG